MGAVKRQRAGTPKIHLLLVGAELSWKRRLRVQAEPIVRETSSSGAGLFDPNILYLETKG